MLIKSQFTQAPEALPLCSLKTAFVLWLTGNILLLQVFALAMPTWLDWRYALSQYALHSVWFNITVLSSLPILCALQHQQFKQHKQLKQLSHKTLLGVPTLLAVIWASLQGLLWGQHHTGLWVLTPWIFGLMLKAGMLMLSFSAIWVWGGIMPAVPVAALEEADLRHLGAAIRPHFFFNALNAVMGLIRTQPKQAEAVLQDTAELFRSVMMQHEHRLVSLATELETCEQYTRIEYARLAERLQLVWRVDQALLAVSVPPFCLQPLIENAIRHGIEPLAHGGRVTIVVQRQEQRISLAVRNPVVSTLGHYTTLRAKQHNGIALDNIAARLRLMYDQAAQFEHGVVDGQYEAEIILPLEFI